MLEIKTALQHLHRLSCSLTYQYAAAKGPMVDS
jgi:hypothetical protein